MAKLVLGENGKDSNNERHGHCFKVSKKNKSRNLGGDNERELLYGLYFMHVCVQYSSAQTENRAASSSALISDLSTNFTFLAPATQVTFSELNRQTAQKQAPTLPSLDQNSSLT